jgi:hypothetical protein
MNMGGLGGAFGAPAQTYSESQTSTFLQQQKQRLPPKPPRQLQPAPSNYTAVPPSAPTTVTSPQQQFVNECKAIFKRNLHRANYQSEFL